MIILWLIIATMSSSDAGRPWISKHGELLDIVQEFIDAVTSSYLTEARCIAVVASSSMTQLSFTGLPVLNVAFDGNETEFDSLILNAINTGCLAFVIQTDNVKWMVEKISELTRSPRAVYRSNYRYIFSPEDVTDVDSSWEAAVDEAFATRCMNWMPDLLAVHFVVGTDALKKLKTLKQISLNVDKSLTGEFDVQRSVNVHGDVYALEIYTHRFVGQYPSERMFLDIWLPGHGFVLDQQLFPDKLRNLMGKELTISSISYPPFSLLLLDTDPPVFAGIDFQIWYEFIKRYNCNWNIVLDLENWWGEIWENGSGNGMAGALAEDTVDIAFGAVYMFHREFFYTEFSVIYQRTGITVVAPRPKPIPGWFIPMQPFSGYMWCAVLASIFVITFMLYIVSKVSATLIGGNISSRYSTLQGCGFRTVGLLVLQVPEDERDYATLRYAPMRHLVTWLILFFLVVSSAYGGSFSSILTLPQFEPPIDTIEDLAKSGIQWAAVTPAFTSYLNSSPNPVIQTITRNFIVLSEEEIFARAFDDIGLVVERLQVHYAEVKYIFEEMMQDKRLMKEDLYSGYCVFSMRKGSPYRENINDILFRVRETGIVLYWESRTVENFLSERRQLSVMQSRTVPKVGHIKLRLYHVQGPFYLLIFGLLISLVVFVLEILIFHCPERTNCKKPRHFN